MTPPLVAARPGAVLHRVGRAPDAWAWPPWSYAGEDGTLGNRFDDPVGEYRVLYASSQRVGTFLETLARYRPDPAIVDAYEEIPVDAEDADRHPTILRGCASSGPPRVYPGDLSLRLRTRYRRGGRAASGDLLLAVEMLGLVIAA